VLASDADPPGGDTPDAGPRRARPPPLSLPWARAAGTAAPAPSACRWDLPPEPRGSRRPGALPGLAPRSGRTPGSHSVQPDMSARPRRRPACSKRQEALQEPQ